MNENQDKIALLQQLKELKNEQNNLRELVGLNKSLVEAIKKSINEVEFLDTLNEPFQSKKMTKKEKIDQTRILTKKVISFICRRDMIDQKMAEDDFKKSIVYMNLRKNNLYYESVENIYILYKQEKRDKLLRDLKRDEELLESIDQIIQETIEVLAIKNIDIGINNNIKK